MKKILYQLLALILIFCTFPVVNVSAESAESSIESSTESPTVGLALLNVRIPEDFNQIVYLQLTNDAEDPKIYSIHPDTNYMTEAEIPVGTYSVDGYISKDLNSQYYVIPITETVTISSNADAFIELSVVKTPESDSEAIAEKPSDNSQTEQKEDTDIGFSEDNSEAPAAQTSVIGNLVTAIVVFIIVFCVAIFICFVYRYRGE